MDFEFAAREVCIEEGWENNTNWGTFSEVPRKHCSRQTVWFLFVHMQSYLSLWNWLPWFPHILLEDLVILYIPSSFLHLKLVCPEAAVSVLCMPQSLAGWMELIATPFHSKSKKPGWASPLATVWVRGHSEWPKASPFTEGYLPTLQYHRLKASLLVVTAV